MTCLDFLIRAWGKKNTMKTKLITPPATLPVPVSDIKDHLRIAGDDGSYDFMFTQLITSAVERVKEDTGRVLITQTWDLIFESWNELIWKDRLCGIKRILPYGLCQSVSSIKYKDEDKTVSEVSQDYYEVSGLNTDNGTRIVFHSAGGFNYPAVYEVDPITVRIVSGYGTSGDTVPEQIQTAIKIIVSDIYDGEDSEKTIKSLLKPYKLWSF